MVILSNHDAGRGLVNTVSNQKWPCHGELVGMSW
jgi:hypothetical protein